MALNIDDDNDIPPSTPPAPPPTPPPPANRRTESISSFKSIDLNDNNQDMNENYYSNNQHKNTIQLDR